MEIRPCHRAPIAALVASSIVAVAGCAAPGMTPTPQPTRPDDAPRKEYKWQDMSVGKSFFRPISPPSE